MERNWTGRDSRYLYRSKPDTVASHEWRVVVYDSDRYGAPALSDFEWRTGPETPWRASENWPGHDINERNSGLPASLERLAKRHRAKVAQLVGVPR